MRIEDGRRSAIMDWALRVVPGRHEGAGRITTYAALRVIGDIPVIQHKAAVTRGITQYDGAFAGNELLHGRAASAQRLVARDGPGRPGGCCRR